MTNTRGYLSPLLFIAGILVLQSSLLAAQQPKATVTELMKLSGCLRSSAAGDSKMTPQPVVYTLDVAAAHDEKSATSSAAKSSGGAEGKSSAPLKPATYTITAPVAVGLAAHVNHRVELTGRMREGNATTTGTPGPPSPETAEATDPRAAAANRTFEVESLKMISTTCPAPKPGVL